MRTGSCLLALGVVALFATRMDAQTCSGSAAFSAGPIQLGAGLGTSEGFKSYGLDVAAGAKAGPYAWANLARAEYADVDGSATGVGVGAGYAIDLTRARTMQFCPEASISHWSGPDFDYYTQRVTTSFRAVALGGTFGGVVRVAPMLDLVPFVGAYYRHDRASATLDGATDSQSEEYSEIDVGAGFVINRTLTLRPSVDIPVGLDGAKSELRFSFSYNFGATKQ